MTLRNPDVIAAIAITSIAFLVIGGGLTTPDPGFGVVGPAVFPVAIGILMLVSAVWLLRSALTAEAPVLAPVDRSPLAASLAATAAYLLAFVPLGFAISGTLFLVVEARILGSRSLVRDAIAAALFVGALYILFVRFLTIDLPHGPFPRL